MISASPRRHRHRKRVRNVTPLPPGMFFVPYGQAPLFDGSSASSLSSSSLSSSSSYSGSESEGDEQVAKKMLTEMRSLRKSTETLLTRQRDLQQKLEKHLKASVSQAKPKKPAPPKKAAPIKKASPVKKTTPAVTKPTPRPVPPSKPSTSTIATRRRGPLPVVVSRKRPKKDVTVKHKKVTKNHVLQLIRSQSGYDSTAKATQAYDKLVGLARKEVALMQTAMGTPGQCTETFGNDLVMTHRLSARKNLERMALSDVTPRVDLTVCPDSWAADYILRRVWESIRYRDKRQQSEEAEGGSQQSEESEDEESDSTGRASRIPEVRSES